MAQKRKRCNIIDNDPFFAVKKISLTRHTGEKPYDCPSCEKAFSYSSALVRHIRTHTGEKPFKCPTCKSGFSQHSNLTRHIRTHTGEKPFECQTCKKAFSRQGDLTRHIRTHTEEKPYDCPSCEKAFSYSTALVRHIRTHTGEKPFECPICKSGFSQHGNLTRHIRTHTGEKPFECQTCKKAFSKKGNLKRHEELHEIQSSFTIECEYADSLMEKFDSKKHGLRCWLKFPNNYSLAQHVKRCHSPEMLDYVYESETKLARFLEEKKVDFDRDYENMIKLRSCEFGDARDHHDVGDKHWCRPDFRIFRTSFACSLKTIPYVFVGNDEDEHRGYETIDCHKQCEFGRMGNIYSKVKKPDMYHPMVYIRFNPHKYTKKGVEYNPPIRDRFETLYDLICSIYNGSYKIKNQGLSIIYMYYSTEKEDEISEHLVQLEKKKKTQTLSLKPLPKAYQLSCFWDCVHKGHPQSLHQSDRVIDIIS